MVVILVLKTDNVVNVSVPGQDEICVEFRNISGSVSKSKMADPQVFIASVSTPTARMFITIPAVACNREEVQSVKHCVRGRSIY